MSTLDIGEPYSISAADALWPRQCGWRRAVRGAGRGSGGAAAPGAGGPGGPPVPGLGLPRLQEDAQGDGPARHGHRQGEEEARQGGHGGQ